MRIKKTVAMAVKTGKLTANGARKEQFFQRDFGDLEVQMGVGDAMSPILVLGITNFGNNWGERAWNRVSGQRGTQLWQVNPLFITGETCTTRDPLEAQGGVVGEGGGEGLNIPEGLRQEIRGG